MASLSGASARTCLQSTETENAVTGHRVPDRSFAAFLFDMGGTIVNSIAAAN
jgi:hypothetical protein